MAVTINSTEDGQHLSGELGPLWHVFVIVPAHDPHGPAREGNVPQSGQELVILQVNHGHLVMEGGKQDFMTLCTLAGFLRACRLGT